MAYQRKYTREQLIAKAIEKDLYPPENATQAQLSELRANQEADRRKIELKTPAIGPTTSCRHSALPPQQTTKGGRRRD